MLKPRFINSRVHKREVAMAATVVLAAGGVAFALLQVQDKLVGNTISSESANMVIAGPSDSNFGPTTAGFNFSGIIPGMQPSQPQTFYLRNMGTSQLALKMSLTSTPTNPDNIDLTKVHVKLTPNQLGTSLPYATPQDFTLKSLVDAGPDGIALNYPAALPGDHVAEGFKIQVAMDDGASGNNGATISNIDFGFTGTAVAN